MKESAVPSARASSSVAQRFAWYLAIARPDHWLKNIFMFPGIALGLFFVVPDWGRTAAATVLALAALCLASSANYTINEYLDAAFDQYHPKKKERVGARRLLDGRLVALQYLILLAVSLGLGACVNARFALVLFMLLVMGIIYNVEPVRSKDRPYLDVLSESINNPLRFLLGWFVIIQDSVPPSSIVIAYWMAGAFLMAVKRYSEYRWIGDADIAGQYRKSFKFYNENSLLLSSFFYALCSSFFLGVFLIKYRVEFLLTFPLVAILFTWYLAIGMRPNSAAQAPEKLYREGRLLGLTVLLVIVALVALFVDMPALNILMEPLKY